MKNVRLELVVPFGLYKWLREVAQDAGHRDSRRAAIDLLEKIMADDLAEHGRGLDGAEALDG